MSERDPDVLLGMILTEARHLTISDAGSLYLVESEPYSHNPSFDREHGYRCRSMLIVPMNDHRDRVVGVLQLINKKSDSQAVIRDEASSRQHVLGYEERDLELVQSLAGQAAVSIENGRIYKDIENLFEGFIKASVIAIDQRDPTTSGHSVRVATLTCDIAEVADQANDGPFRDTISSRKTNRK